MNAGYCCKEFGSAVLENEFEREADSGRWRVIGCDQCYVAKELKYCPYCGLSLAKRKH